MLSFSQCVLHCSLLSIGGLPISGLHRGESFSSACLFPPDAETLSSIVAMRVLRIDQIHELIQLFVSERDELPWLSATAIIVTFVLALAC
jgi:hypothetical protein